MKPNTSKPTRSYLPFILIAAVLLAALAAGAVLYRRSSSSPEKATANSSTQYASTANTSTATNSTASAPVRPATAATEPGAVPPRVRGNTAAPVTLEEFGDFQCPPCGAFHPELKKIEAEFGERLRVVFRHLPLRIHEHAMDAARAAEAAGRQGRFWEMHDLLFENQNVWKNEPNVRQLFATYARTLGLDVARFTADMDANEVNARIAADLRRADSLGVSGTPTVFVEGAEVDFKVLSRPGGLSGAIKDALAKKGK